MNHHINRITVKRTITSLLAAATAFFANGQEEHNRLGLNIGFDGDFYHLEMTYHYMLCPYVGIGGGLGYWSAISNDGLLGDILYPDDYDYYYDDRDYDLALFIEPSIVLQSPVIKFRDQNLGISFTVIPSARFSTNYNIETTSYDHDRWNYENYDCDNISFGLQAGPTLHVGPMTATIGYVISTLDVNRNYKPETRRYTRSPYQGAFIEIAARF